MRQLTKASLTIVAPLMAAALAGAACSGSDEGNAPEQDWRDVPEIVSFMEDERDLYSDEILERLREALDDGGLAADPDTFHVATSSLLGSCETRCVGTIKAVQDDAIVVISVETGREWMVPVDRSTRVARGGTQIGLSELEKGEFVDTLGRDGGAAMLVLSFSEPLAR
jgi:hypothetical protein